MRIFKRKITSAVIMLALGCSLINTENIASAAGYKSFYYVFNCIPSAPSGESHINQTVEVQGNANANAYANCTQYSYSGNRPVLTVVSVSNSFPTNSTSFTGKSDGHAMKYTDAIPPTNKTVKFKGSVSNYTSFTIASAVKG